MPAPPELVELLARHGQEHLLQGWDSLNPGRRARLESDLRSIDLPLIDELVSALVRGQAEADFDPARVGPVAVRRLPRTDGERASRRLATERGEAMLRDGEVGVILVAGGQGTRLGFDAPKGTYPIGPVSAASLFQIHAEKIVALGRRYGKAIPLYVMTSPENHEATGRFFAEHGNFGLEHLRLFQQGTMPAVDRETGKILLADADRVALSPDGHGGTLRALAMPGPSGEPSCLEELRERGIRTLFYFQVDNPMVRIAEPTFLGFHHESDAEVSFKVDEKIEPEERVGVVVEVDGVPRVIEYSDLPPALAELREPDGSLSLWAGSIAIHIFEREFIERAVTGGAHLPYHRALKKVPFVGEGGKVVTPGEPNAVKFETFIFDTLPMARKFAIVETDRAIEFEPLKNATGPDSPATVRQRMSDLFGGWLEGAGVTVPRRSDGSIPFGLEISPLFALDAAELQAKLPPDLVVEEPLYLR
ncbi:MAG: UTP--glucose-1-phosphate uridylyltransferase [Isosphaeraceae bacterium]